MELSLILMSLLLVTSNIYWAFVNARLVNKLMSRNYSDYQVASTITEKKNNIEMKNEYHPEDLGSLTEF